VMIMKKLIYISILILTISLMAKIKVAVLSVRGPNYTLGLMEAIDAVFAEDSTIDLVLGPAEVLGGDTNRARIVFEDSAGTIIPRSDGFSRSWCVKSTIEGAQFLAQRYSATIIPGTLWEIDENLRCYESTPIIGPDGRIQRVRRKAHNAKTDYAIDPTIRLDTITTRDADEYTFMLAISNETRDLWDVYPFLSFYNPDLLLVSTVHWNSTFYQITNIIETGYRPDPAFLRSYVSNWDSGMLGHLASRNTVFLLSCLDTLPGGLFGANFYEEYLPDHSWFGFDNIVATPHGAIYLFDPHEPLVYHQMHIAIRATDSLGAPVESVFVNFGAPGEIPTNAGWTNAQGIFSHATAIAESVFFLMAKDSFVIVPEETIVYVSVDNPACTVDVRVEIDSTYSIAERALPGDFEIRAYPNPFNSSVTISISGVCDTPLRVEIYDVAGRLIHIIARPNAAAISQNNRSSVSLDTRRDDVSINNGGFVWTPDESLGSGVYLIKIGNSQENKLIKTVYLK